MSKAPNIQYDMAHRTMVHGYIVCTTYSLLPCPKHITFTEFTYNMDGTELWYMVNGYIVSTTYSLLPCPKHLELLHITIWHGIGNRGTVN